VRRLSILAAAAALLAGCGSSGSKPEAPPAPARTFAGAELTPPRAAPPIALHDAAGRRVTLASQRGRYVLVTFIYTRCPDVCPLITQNLNGALRALHSDKVTVLAVSVDPKNDTAAAVRAYTKRMRLRPAFRYLIGTRAALEPVWAAWHVLAVAAKLGVVNHVAYTALVDPKGRERLVYGSSVRAAQVVHDLRLLMRRSA
jgi:protein SCO1